jgi:ribonuclease BN (tRNA processing enzyme)
MAKNRSKITKPDLDSEFAELFWDASNNTSELPVVKRFEPLAKFAKTHKWKWAEQLLKARRLNIDDKYQQALDILNNCEKDIPIKHRALYLFIKAVALNGTDQKKEAIKTYREVLACPKCANLAYAWNNLGNIFKQIGNFDEASKSYRQAIADQNNTTPWIAWSNLGFAYLEQGKKKDSRAAFKAALTDPKVPEAARDRIQFGLDLLKGNIKPSALSPDDQTLVESPPNVSTGETEAMIIEAIRKAGDTQYDKYIEKSDSNRNDTLSILRGWSSAVTLLEGSERRWRGGGYFLKWRGHGIAIDPGFDFLRNFHDAGYHGREIHAVVISHHHPDHNSDLKDIDDLRYELYKRRAARKSRGCEPYVLLWDQDTNNEIKFGITTPAHHYEPIVFPSGYPQPIDLAVHHAKLPIRITPFKVNHGSDVPHAMGMVVELLDNTGKIVLRIGYTADTAYFQDLHKHLSNCDILIAHISQPSMDELTDASKLKEVHLGYRGTARLLKECNPKLALIGEFWAGFTDLRIALVKGLREQSTVKAILPTGLAMHLKLPSLEIECTECGRPTPFDQVKVAPPTDNFGSLAYLCPKCLLQ